MSAELDDDLTADQWEALRSLRLPARSGEIRNEVAKRLIPDRFIVDGLIALGLATMADGRPVLTPKGRTVLIRGSSRLLDVAA